MLSWPGRVKLALIYQIWWQNNDVMSWKHFPHHQPFVLGIHQWPQMGQLCGALCFCFLLLVLARSWTNRWVVGDGIIENIGDLVKPLKSGIFQAMSYENCNYFVMKTKSRWLNIFFRRIKWNSFQHYVTSSSAHIEKTYLLNYNYGWCEDLNGRIVTSLAFEKWPL